VDELRVGGERHLSWDEATEREVVVRRLKLAELLESPKRVQIDIPEGSREEPLKDSTGGVVGALVRRWRCLRGAVEMEAKPLCEGTLKVTVRVTNTTP
jgi:hypothetical protein